MASLQPVLWISMHHQKVISLSVNVSFGTRPRTKRLIIEPLTSRSIDPSRLCRYYKYHTSYSLSIDLFSDINEVIKRWRYRWTQVKYVIYILSMTQWPNKRFADQYRISKAKTAPYKVNTDFSTAAELISLDSSMHLCLCRPTHAAYVMT